MKEIQEILAKAIQVFEKIFEAVQTTMHKLGKLEASSSLVEKYEVDYFGVKTPLPQIATVSKESARTLLITPWEKKLVPKIYEAINKDKEADYTLYKEEKYVRLVMPPLSGDFRSQQAKKLEKEGENGRVSMRQERKKTNKLLEDLKSGGVSEDDIKRGKSDLQKLVDKYVDKLTELQGEIIKKINKI